MMKRRIQRWFSKEGTKDDKVSSLEISLAEYCEKKKKKNGTKMLLPRLTF